MRKPSPSLPPDHPEVVAERLSEMERKIERLRTLYESFFSGVDRRPPSTPRREMNRLMLETQQLSIRNAGLRFRFQTLSQRWTLFTTYWNRTLREMEAGTYRKDLAKVQRRLAQRGQPLSETEAVAMGIPLTRAKAFVQRQNKYLPAATAAATAPETAPETAPNPEEFDSTATVAEGAAPLPAAPAARTPTAPAAAPKAPAPRPAAPVAVPGVSDQDLTALHARYNQALAALPAPRPPVSVEKLRQMLAGKTPDILRQHDAARVSFDVATKDGKVVLKARPIK